MKVGVFVDLFRGSMGQAERSLQTKYERLCHPHEKALIFIARQTYAGPLFPEILDLSDGEGSFSKNNRTFINIELDFFNLS